jgi:hypothetical protein
MKPLRATAAVIGVAFLLGAGADTNFPAGLRTAKQQYDTALTRATSEYQRQCKVAADRYLGELKVGLKLAMKDEKLDDANKIKAEMESVQGANLPAQADDTLSRISGVWEVEWSAKNPIRYRFAGNAVECLAPPPWHAVGKTQVVGPNEIFAVMGTYNQRWTLAGNRVFIESWENKPPQGRPDAMAVGVRPK